MTQTHLLLLGCTWWWWWYYCQDIPSSSTLLLSHIREGDRHIAIAVASSGLAAQLLPDGMTAHIRFMAPIDRQALKDGITLVPKEGINQSNTPDLLRHASLLVWDEAPMMDLHTSLNPLILLYVTSVTVHTNPPFGCGIVVVLSGDYFRQCLPVVVPRGSRTQIVVDLCINRSHLWPNYCCCALTLTQAHAGTQCCKHPPPP